MSVSPLQRFGALRCVTSSKFRSPVKLLAWLRIPLSVNWLLCNTWDRLEFAISRESRLNAFLIFMKNILLKHKKILIILTLLLSVYLLYCGIVSRQVVETSGTSDLVEFSRPSNKISRILLLSLARLSGAPVFRDETDFRAPHDGVYAGIYSSQVDENGFVTLSCVSPALKLSQYILATGYWEQLQNGMLNLINLAELAVDLDRLPVFPQVSNSRLFGIPHLGAKSVLSGPTHSLELYYSLSELNQNLCRRTETMFDTFFSFLQRSPRQILLGIFIHSEHTKDEWLLPGRWSDQVATSLQTQASVDCTEFLKDSIITKLERNLNSDRFSLFQQSFYIHKAVCINSNKNIHVLEFSKIFSSLSDEPNSILLVNWRGLPRKRSDTSKRIQLQTIATFSDLPHWPVSDMVRTASRTYLRSLNLSRPLIGLHVRLEKLGARAMKASNPDTFMTECLSELATHLKAITAAAPEATSLLPICDLGMYGSESCQGCTQGNWALDKFMEKGIHFRFYNPNLSNGETDTGFVSLVEMTTLVESQFLVLVGGGGYQRQLAHRFRYRLGGESFREGDKDIRLKEIC
ncbi:hypothetical protein LOD99_15994 [Oopsacas minuta]|uniref:O-fucosyltransferase family protein n=1 Tax=Oopsacas minuta TaxID=111878 RepID=A0AAV7K6I3_9METZ|nr:hypothetical protein LOD99_15994 [Oopsacas minuta]